MEGHNLVFLDERGGRCQEGLARSAICDGVAPADFLRIAEGLVLLRSFMGRGPGDQGVLAVRQGAEPEIPVFHE